MPHGCCSVYPNTWIGNGRGALIRHVRTLTNLSNIIRFSQGPKQITSPCQPGTFACPIRVQLVIECRVSVSGYGKRVKRRLA